MPSAGFEITFPANKLAYTNALDRTATGIGVRYYIKSYHLTYILTYYLLHAT